MANLAAERIFGYARNELVEQPVENLVPARFHHAHPGYRQGFLAEPNARAMGAGRDLYGRRKDGSEFPVEIGLNPIETQAGSMVLSAIVDITERKHREERIRAALQEKELLLGEIHHRVKNNLQIVDSLLDLQAGRIDDPAVQMMLRDSQNRIRSMSLIHQTLYQSKDFARVDFQHFIGQLVPVLMASYATDADRVVLHIDAQQVQLPINVAIPCGLIINELVTNALKHGFPAAAAGNIWVELTQQFANEVMLAVSNDGVAIAPELDFTRMETLGMQLVNLLTQQIQGRLVIQRAGPTQFRVCFPTGESA
jgi:PAS domain S-box-containing protein